jgi:cytochrome b subunit of formate dehydrogenase
MTLVAMYSYKSAMLGLIAVHEDSELLRRAHVSATKVEQIAAWWFFSESLGLLLIFVSGIVLNVLAGLSAPSEVWTGSVLLPTSVIAGWTRLSVGIAITLHLLFSLWCRAAITRLLDQKKEQDVS